MLKPKRAAVIGGGVPGLVAAYELEKAGVPWVELFEACSRVGGKVWTSSIEGFAVEHGPDCFVASKPGLREIVCELGLDGELVEPLARSFSLLMDGQLYGVPPGLARLSGPSDEAVSSCSFLSSAGRDRVLSPGQIEGDSADESVRSFFTRRFGAEYSRKVAEPLLAGIHSTPADRLSMRALYGPFYEPTSLSPVQFLSFRSGMGSLVEGLRSALKRTAVRLGCSISSLSEVDADLVVVALPLPFAAPVLGSANARAAEILGSIRHADAAVRTLSFRRSQIRDPLQSSGFLRLPDEEGALRAATFVTSKWPDRAPEGCVSVRMFLRSMDSADEAEEELLALLRISGSPLFAIDHEHRFGMPQVEVGHLGLMAELFEALRATPRVRVIGSGLPGVGLSDCALQARGILG